MDSSYGGGGVYAGADALTQQHQMSGQQGSQIVGAVVPQNNSVWQQGVPVDPKEAGSKTPISLLQEKCTRKGVTPQYELLSTEGQVHEPTFMYRVTVNDMQATGQGKSKKVAKHLAAKGLLEKIVSLDRYIEWNIPGRSHAEATEYVQKLAPEPAGKPKGPSGGDGAGGEPADKFADNPVGRLQEKTMRNKWPPPEYELMDAQGQPHERVFKVSCRIGKFEEKGEAKSKKVAKRLAAEKMIAFLENQPKQDGFEGDEEALIEKFKKALKPLGVRPLTKHDVKKVEAFFSPIKERPAEGLRPVRGRKGGKGAQGDVGAELGMVEATGVLSRVAAEHGFPVNYVDIETKRPDGQYQCLVQLSTMPVAVCYGQGKNRDEAQWSAAYNALHYLKMMVNNGGGAKQ